MKKYDTKEDHLIIKLVEENECVLDKELLNELAILVNRTPKSVKCRFYNHLRLDCMIYHMMVENPQLLNKYTHTLLKKIANELGIELNELMTEFYDVNSTKIWSMNVLTNMKILITPEEVPEIIEEKGFFGRLFDKLLSIFR